MVSPGRTPLFLFSCSDFPIFPEKLRSQPSGQLPRGLRERSNGLLPWSRIQKKRIRSNSTIWNIHTTSSDGTEERRKRNPFTIELKIQERFTSVNHTHRRGRGGNFLNAVSSSPSPFSSPLRKPSSSAIFQSPTDREQRSPAPGLIGRTVEGRGDRRPPIARRTAPPRRRGGIRTRRSLWAPPPSSPPYLITASDSDRDTVAELALTFQNQWSTTLWMLINLKPNNFMRLSSCSLRAVLTGSSRALLGRWLLMGWLTMKREGETSIYDSCFFDLTTFFYLWGP